MTIARGLCIKTIKIWELIWFMEWMDRDGDE